MLTRTVCLPFTMIFVVYVHLWDSMFAFLSMFIISSTLLFLIIIFYLFHVIRSGPTVLFR